MQYKWIVLSNTTLGVLMSGLDTNIVLIALPTIAKELPGTSLLDLILVLLGYQLITASVLINFGRLADMFGRVKLYNLGFAIFTIGSALCGFSQSGTQLIIFRMIQALGAGFLFSNSAALITDAFPEQERGKALGINQVAMIVGSVVGLVLGGFMTGAIGWRSIFLINIPIGIFATIWSHYQLHELAIIGKGQKVDIPGNITLVAGIVTILTAMTLYAIALIGFLEFCLFLGGGIILIAAFAWIETRTKQPMLDLSLFKIRMFSAGNIAIFLNSLARGAVSLVLILYLQGPAPYMMGLDPLTAGIFVLPVSAALAIFGPASGWLSDRYGARALASLGLLVSSVGFLLVTGIGLTVTFQQILIPLILIGAGMGLFMAPNRASIMNSVTPETRGIASGISTTLMNLGGVFSLGLTFLILATNTSMADLTSIFFGGTPEHDPSLWIGNFLNSIHFVFLLSTIFLLIAIIPSVLRGPKAKFD